MAYDSKLVEAIRRGRQPEPDDRAARYLIDELEKCCLHDPDADSRGPRYDTLMTALEAVCERREIDFSPRYPSLRSWGRAQEGSILSASFQREAARAQFAPVLDALDGITDSELHYAVDERELEGWPAINAALEDVRAEFALASTSKEYRSIAIECREVFVALADLAYDEGRHGLLPAPEPGAGGGRVKPRLEVIRIEAAGASNKEMRSLVLNSLDLANKLQHSRGIERWRVASMIDATVLSVALIGRLVERDV
jgi:hypothetical protein